MKLNKSNTNDLVCTLLLNWSISFSKQFVWINKKLSETELLHKINQAGQYCVKIKKKKDDAQNQLKAKCIFWHFRSLHVLTSNIMRIMKSTIRTLHVVGHY